MSSIPQQAPQQPAPTYTLFDAGAVAIATFFGTPVAGSALMALNYRRLGRTRNSITTLVLGIAVTAVAILLGWNLPRSISSLVALALVFGTQRCAVLLQGPALKDHLQQGGHLGSKWAAFGLGTAFLATLFAVVFLALFIPDFVAKGSRVAIGSKDEIYYSGSATKEDAVALGNALKAGGYFTDRGADVLLAKGKDGTIVSFVVKDGFWNQPGILSSFEEVARQAAPSVGGFPIQVRLVNAAREVEKQSTVGSAVFAGRDHVYYLGQAKASEAQALGQALQSAGFFQDKGIDVFLSRHEDGTVLAFVVGAGVWDDPALVAGFEKIARQAAPAVGGLPLRLRLVDTSLEIKKDEVLH